MYYVCLVRVDLHFFFLARRLVINIRGGGGQLEIEGRGEGKKVTGLEIDRSHSLQAISRRSPSVRAWIFFFFFPGFFFVSMCWRQNVE